MASETGRVAATLQQQGAHGHRGMPHMPFVQPQAGLNSPFPMPSGQFPPHLQNALQNHLQALGQQIGAQMAMHGNQVGQGLPLNTNQAQGSEQQPPFSPPSFQQIVAQQQQARAAAGRQGAGDSTRVQETNAQVEVPEQTSGAATSPNEHTNPNIHSFNNHTASNNNQNPNGEGWRMVIQSTSTVTGLNPNLQRVPTPVNIAFPQPPGTASQSAPTMPIGSMPLQGPGNGPLSAPNQMQLQVLEQEISAIQTTLTRGTAPAPSVFDNARTMLRNVENINATPGLEAMFRTQIDTLATQADQLRTSLNRMLMQVVSQQPGSQSAPLPINAEPSPSYRNLASFPSHSASSSSSSVYVLSSPNGPQALLVSPAGTYRAPWHMTQFGLAPQQSRHNRAFNHPPNNNNNNHVAPGPQPRIIPAHGAQAQPQHPVPQRGNEARDLLRLLLPLGGHIWLLIRLFGFVYFFTAGGGSRRALLLGFIAFVVFVAQTGIFRPLIQAVWEPLRRHVEGLVAGNDEPVPAPAAPPAPAEAAARPNREPTPQEAAARLLQQQRQRRDPGAWFRRIERAVALFIASLVPGFGERQIAARDVAEAARRAEERDREEREERARREQAESRAAAETRGENGEEGSPSTAQGQGPASQSEGDGERQTNTPPAPLLEI